MREIATRSTRTDTLFPYTKLFRFGLGRAGGGGAGGGCGSASRLGRDARLSYRQGPRRRAKAARAAAASGPSGMGPRLAPARAGTAAPACALVAWRGQRHRSAAPAGGGRCRASGLAASRIVRAAARRSARRSEEHTSELQSLMRISYAVFCLKKKTTTTQP